MNKTELISAIAGKTGFSKVNSKKALDAFFSTVSDELKKGGKVTLVGHGSYRIVEKSARMGVNPRTKAPMKIPAKKTVRFRPGVNLI